MPISLELVSSIGVVDPATSTTSVTWPTGRTALTGVVREACTTMAWNSCAPYPGLVIFTRYVPMGRSTKEYVPLRSVLPMRTLFVDCSTSSTLAPGMTAPLMSATVSWMVPCDPLCASVGNEHVPSAQARASAKRITRLPRFENMCDLQISNYGDL